MKRKGKILRRIYIGLGIFGILALISVGGMFFIFGEDTLAVVGLMGQGAENGRQNDLRDSDVALDEEGNVVSGGGASGGGGGASGGGGGGSSSDSLFVCSEWQQVQYSIGNFVDNIECLVYGVGGCERVKAICGAEIFNLDDEVGGVFGIRFSLFSGNEVSLGSEILGEEVSFKIVEQDIGARERISLMSEIVVDGEFDMASLKCVVDSDRVPEKCLY